MGIFVNCQPDKVIMTIQLYVPTFILGQSIIAIVHNHLWCRKLSHLICAWKHEFQYLLD